MFILLLFVTLANSKCLLWRQYSHSKTESNYIKSPVYWDKGNYAYGYGYERESLSLRPGCDDMESFHQCEYVQRLLGQDKYLECHKHIHCRPELPDGNGQWWCVNQNSQDLCRVAQSLLTERNITIACDEVFELVDDVPVLFYSKPSLKTPSPTSSPTISPTSSPTPPPTTAPTSPPTTEIPSSGSSLFCFGLSLLIIQLLLSWPSF